MREIKFRAWTNYGEMLPNVQNHIGNGSWAFGKIIKDENFYLMQYTGLKDKNGKEIYESDVVLKSESKFCQIGEVKFINGCWMVSRKEEEYFNLHFYRKDCKVIGNIHENTELL